jgi:hypothetical protein
MQRTKNVTIFIDLEGALEVPYRVHHECLLATETILKILDKYEVKAVFNVCGIIVHRYPELVRNIHNRGHEIATHGYAHENFVQLSNDQLDMVLDETEELFVNTTGQKPLGIRCPWLIWDPRIYSLLKSRGYRWVSNERMFHAERFLLPYQGGDLRFPGSLRLLQILFRLKWAFFPKRPYRNYGLLEIPLLSSMDGELLGLVSPVQESPRLWINFAFEALKKQFNRSDLYFNLNFHDWLVGSANRTLLLEMLLHHCKAEKASFVLAREILDSF